LKRRNQLEYLDIEDYIKMGLIACGDINWIGATIINFHAT
jgi:hypothetical protein